MKSVSYKVEIYVDVYDKQALRFAAEANFMRANFPNGADNKTRHATLTEYRAMRKSNSSDSTLADLIQIFDPGHSPPGSQIVESQAEKIEFQGTPE